MTPSARIEAAIEILTALEATGEPADRFLRNYFRARRYAGSKDRADVAERVFTVLRHRSSFAWRMKSANPRALVIASLLREGVAGRELNELFGGRGYGPKPLSSSEEAAIDAAQGELPREVRGEYPAFLEPELARAFQDTLDAEMEAMQARAGIDLRVNTLKAARDDIVGALLGEGFELQRTPHAPDGIRVASGRGASGLSRTLLFENGLFEFQDEAAQIAALLVDAKPGQRVLDLAAGAGGKALAIAAQMKNEGEIVASDIREGALAELEERAGRAGVTIIRTALLEHHAPEGAFDRVFVDAPCSGTGVWRRQPELRWRLTPRRLRELTAQQDVLLDEAASRVAPGGRMVYATCSVLPLENEDRVGDFLARHPEYDVVPADTVWSRAEPKAASLPRATPYFRASPAAMGTDGFFAAILTRRES